MHGLYPPIKTYTTHSLKVDDGHQLHIEECGNPDGVAAIVVHGGPGNGCHKDLRRFFDPERYRIILFDQRGAGRSSPYASLKNNSTDHLIRDMEAIREYLDVEQWVMFGSGWGGLLTLAYAQQHTNHVHAIVLHGSFLGRKLDFAWRFGHGTNVLFPDHWQTFTGLLNKDEQKNIIESYYSRLTGKDELARMAAAKAWAAWHAHCISLQPHSHIIEEATEPHFAIASAKIGCHYLVNHYFLQENQILENMDKIKHIPGYIIHGRYDLLCPLEGAWQLHQKWPNAKLYIIRDAGHFIKEVGIIDAVILATNRLAKQPTIPAC